MEGTKFVTLEYLFESCGASSVDSLDVSDFENANIIHDMNNPVPSHLKLNYQLMYDNGTMEHCFDIKQFMFNTNYMLGSNGIIIHANPLAGFINHGFYTFSPCRYLVFILKITI